MSKQLKQLTPLTPLIPRTTCDYCDHPEKFNLTATTITGGLEGARWHVERTKLAGIPARRIRCQRGS